MHQVVDRAVVAAARWILISKAEHDTDPLDLRVGTLDVVLEFGELNLLNIGQIALLVARFVVHVVQGVERFRTRFSDFDKVLVGDGGFTLADICYALEYS